MKPDSPFAVTVETDLRNLVNAEESYFADHVEYAHSLAPMGFHPSTGVTIEIQGSNSKSWSAIATHTNLPNWMCGVYVGGIAPPTSSQRQGEPTSWRR
jgi:hypothetical protein